MTPTLDMERIVREVLAELQRVGQSAPPAAPSSAPTGEDGRSADGGLRLDARVVTIEQIAGRLSGVRRVRVAPQAIVTPAVRDELQRRGIALEYAQEEGPSPAGGVRLIVVNARKGFQTAALTGALGRDGVQVEVATADCLIAATDRLAADLRAASTLGLLLTPHVAAALCLANRHAGVRAAAAGDLPDMTAAVEAVGANLLVVDPSAAAFFQLKQMASEFCRGGVRSCPAALSSKLG